MAVYVPVLEPDIDQVSALTFFFWRPPIYKKYETRHKSLRKFACPQIKQLKSGHNAGYQHQKPMHVSFDMRGGGSASSNQDPVDRSTVYPPVWKRKKKASSCSLNFLCIFMHKHISF